MRDVRIYDAMILSDDQVASLYSGSFNVTPTHWWKIDEGSGATATIEDYGTATDIDGTGVSLAWTNGTLDLDGGNPLTINQYGTLSAPRGNLQIGNDWAAGHADATFIHNNGTVLMDRTDGNSNLQMDYSPALYNLTIAVPTAQGGVTTRRNFSVENILTINSSCQLSFTSQAAHTITIGTTSAAGTIANSGAIVFGSGSDQDSDATKIPTITGASSLYPASCTGTDWDWDSIGANTRVIKLANLDYDPDLTTGGSGVKIQLVGDCEFDAVTVSSGDTLDLNGQYVRFGDNLILNSGNLDFGDGAIVKASSDVKGEGNQNITFGSGSTLWMNGGTGKDFRLRTGSGSFANDLETLMLDCTTTGAGTGVKVIGNIVGATGGNGVKNVIWAGGTHSGTTHPNIGYDDADDENVVQAIENLTIPVGGVLEADDGTINVAGDFTTSGGLIGKSGMVTAGAADYEGCRPGSSTSNGGGEWDLQSDWNFTGANGITIEGWIKPDDLDFGTGNDAVLFGQLRSGGTGNTHGLGIQILDDKLMMIAASNDASWHPLGAGAVTASDHLTAGKWTHLAMTVDANNSSTPTGKLYVDGKLVAQHTGASAVYYAYQFVIGGHAHSTDGGFVDRWFDGTIARVSAWNVELTQAQIRAMMFEDYDAAVASATPHGNARLWYDFDEGTGVIVDNKGAAGSSMDGTLSGVGTTWASAGTFTYGTSTLKFTGASSKLIAKNDNDFYNLTVDNGAALTLRGVGSTIGAQNVAYRPKKNITTVGTGTITSDSREWINLESIFTNNSGTLVFGTPLTAIAGLYELQFAYTTGATLDLPACKTKTLDIRCSNSYVRLTGDVQTTDTTIVNSSGRIDLNGNTLDAIKYNTASNAQTWFNGGLLTDSVGGGLGFKFDDGTLLSDAGTITGHSNKTDLEVGENWQLTGNITNCELVSASESPTILGSTSNCSAAVPANNKFIQWHQTLDTEQLLDADELGTDDMKLPRPSLDNALQLQTGG